MLFIPTNCLFELYVYESEIIIPEKFHFDKFDLKR